MGKRTNAVCLLLATDRNQAAFIEQAAIGPQRVIIVRGAVSRCFEKQGPATVGHIAVGIEATCTIGIEPVNAIR